MFMILLLLICNCGCLLVLLQQLKQTHQWSCVVVVVVLCLFIFNVLLSMVEKATVKQTNACMCCLCYFVVMFNVVVFLLHKVRLTQHKVDP